MELLQDAPDRRRVDEVMALVQQVVVVHATEDDQVRALRDYRALHLSTGLGLIDAIIGAIVVGLGATLCTFNVRHYHNVPGLTTEQPYPRAS
jgi:predicted nucleic acid-binding protein